MAFEENGAQKTLHNNIHRNNHESLSRATAGTQVLIALIARALFEKQNFVLINY